MAPIYSRHLWSKGLFDTSTAGEYNNLGPGTVIVHDMIYAAALGPPPPGSNVQLSVAHQLTDATIWQLLTWAMQPGATYHWTGRIVLDPGDGVAWQVLSLADSFSGYGYYLSV